MKSLSHSVRTAALVLAWCLMLGLCVWVYWPGLDGPPLLDDNANLDPLEQLVASPELLTDVVRGNLSGPLGRPITMLSFGLEQVYLGGGLREKKQFNLVLHLTIGTLLLLFCRDLFSRLKLARPAFLSLLVASLWLLSPLLLSTVLYSVQRMAQLSTLFTLLALWAYLRCRLAVGLARISWGSVCLLALVCAPLSKENGLLALPLVMLLEWTVLRFDIFSPRARHLWVRAHIVLVVLGLVLVMSVIALRPEFVTAGYVSRDFTLGERLLTQARVLWFSFGQLLWTDRGGLGLYQDSYVLSRSILQPLSTLGAMLGWVLLFPLALWLAWRRACYGVVFGLGFYLVAHAMESTVFPLEIYFEHRNYLPAMGVFIALVSCAAWFAQRFSWLANWLLLVLVLIIVRGAGMLGAEAQLWSHGYLLHITAINRFPDSLRGNVEMSRFLAQGGDLEHAIYYADIGDRLEQRPGLRQQLRRVALHCLGSAAVPAELINRLEAKPADFRDDQVSVLAYILINRIREGACPETDMPLLADRLNQLTLVSEPGYISPRLYVSLAILENHIGRHREALDYVENLLARSPGSVRAMMMKMYFTSVLAMDAEHQLVLKQLQELQAQGLLNQQQQFNLQLFMQAEPEAPLMRTP